MNKLQQHLLNNRFQVILLLILVAAGGTLALRNLKIDVFPDPSPVLVQVLTEAEGLAAAEVERLVSYPLETAFFGLPGMEKITSDSTFGLSTVNVYFADGMDIYFARQLVSQKLPEAAGLLPPAAQAPRLGPISTALGMVFIYYLEGRAGLMELRNTQDWVVKMQLQSLPGVAAVLSHGGEVMQFAVKLSTPELQKYGLSLQRVVQAIEESSLNVTAGYLTRNREEQIVRGLGRFQDENDLARVLIDTAGGVPLYLADIAAIEKAPALRRGAALLSGRGEVVSGALMKLVGVNTAELIGRVEQRMAEINRGLPPGIRIVTVYNQSVLIRAAFSTISRALLLALLLVALVLFIFLGHLRSALVATGAVPFAVFSTFVVMSLSGMYGDLMSLGGLAVALGLLVDPAIVVAENIHRLGRAGAGRDSIPTALSQISRPLLFSMGIILLSFLPVLTLSGVEGKMFRPFAYTLITAFLAALVYALLLAPALVKPGGRPQNSESRFFNRLPDIFLSLFKRLLARPRPVLLFFALVLAGGLVLTLVSGSEFIPTLNEDTAQVEVLLPANTALEESIAVLEKVNAVISDHPAVDKIFTKIGSGEAGTHPHPVNLGYSTLVLKERRHWPEKSLAAIQEKIRSEIKQKVPGVAVNFTQPIKHNLDELLSGVRADLAVKLFGEDYQAMLDSAGELATLLGGIRGLHDVQVLQAGGQYELALSLNREQIARHGLSPAYVLEFLETAVGGRPVAKVYQGERHFDVFVRLAEEYRAEQRQLRDLPVQLPSGGWVPLGALVSINEQEGFSQIKRENGRRYVTVQGNVGGRDLGSIVREAKARLAGHPLPPGSYLSWAGQFELKEKADRRLWLAILLAAALIVFLLLQYLRSWPEVLAVLLTLPLILSGGVISLVLAGAYFSVPAAIGFIILLGIGLANSLVLVSFIRVGLREEEEVDAALCRAVSLRLRPILMTTLTTVCGLMPLIFASGIGAEIQRPLALVVAGGLLFSLPATLFGLPLCYDFMLKKGLLRKADLTEGDV